MKTRNEGRGKPKVKDDAFIYEHKETEKKKKKTKRRKGTKKVKQEKENDDDNDDNNNEHNLVSRHKKRKLKRKVLHDSSDDGNNMASSSDDDSKKERIVSYLNSKERKNRISKALTKLKKKRQRHTKNDVEDDLDLLEDSSTDDLRVSKPKRLAKKKKPKVVLTDVSTQNPTLQNEVPTNIKDEEIESNSDSTNADSENEVSPSKKRQKNSKDTKIIDSDSDSDSGSEIRATKKQHTKPDVDEVVVSDSDSDIEGSKMKNNESNNYELLNTDSDDENSASKSESGAISDINSVVSQGMSESPIQKKKLFVDKIYKIRKSTRLAKKREEKLATIDETSSSSSSSKTHSDAITSEEEGIGLYDTDNESADSRLDEHPPDSVDLVYNESKNGSETDESSIDNGLDNHMSYAALIFSMQMREELEKDEKETVRETLGMLRGMTTEEAFEVWIKDIAKQVEDTLRKKINKSTNSLNVLENYVSSKKYHSAGIQIENPLCTYRESNLSSTAWTRSFRRQLVTRPIYRTTDLDSAEREDSCVCEACGRTNHNAVYKVTFSGFAYDASRTYELVKSTRHTDWERCFQTRTKHFDSESDSSDSSDSDEDSKSKNVVAFNVGKYCRARTQLYHALLHYKFRVFCRIGDRLLGNPVASFLADVDDSKTRKSGRMRLKVKVKDIVRDKNYILEEFDRYQSLLETASNWGSSPEDMINSPAAFLWSEENINPLSSSEKKIKKTKKKSKKKKHDKKEKSVKKAKKKLKKAKALRKKQKTELYKNKKAKKKKKEKKKQKENREMKEVEE